MLRLHCSGFFVKPKAMKTFVLPLLLLSFFSASAQPSGTLSSPNIIIVTIDGIRWQEVFNGADKKIMNRGEYVADETAVKSMYWSEDTSTRRKKLMPFLWNVIAQQGQLYGNRNYNNCVDVANRYKFSYPGYNEMFTGYADAKFIPNTPVFNENTNVLEYLNHQKEYEQKVAAFTSWNIFPYILNEKRSGIMMNCGYEDGSGIPGTKDSAQYNISDKGNTRYDELTFASAKAYIKRKHPKVALIAFGEADEFAHHGQYDKYLRSITDADRMIAELWNYIQSDPFYRNNTTLLITTDHGRGKRTTTWTDHLFLVKGSKEIWMAAIGPDLLPLGEIKTEQVLYQKQIAATIADILGKRFACEHSVAQGIDLPRKEQESQHDNVIVLDHP